MHISVLLPSLLQCVLLSLRQTIPKGIEAWIVFFSSSIQTYILQYTDEW